MGYAFGGLGSSATCVTARHIDESDVPTRFRFAVRDSVTGWAVETYPSVIVDLGRRVLPLYCSIAIVKPTFLAAPGAAEPAMQVDSDPAVVSHADFFGRPKGRFTILGNEGFRLRHCRDDRAEDAVSLRIARFRPFPPFCRFLLSFFIHSMMLPSG